MIYFAHVIHPFTGKRNLVIIQSDREINVHAFIDSIKTPGHLTYTVDRVKDVFDVSYAECVDIPALDQIRSANTLLKEAMQEKRLTKKFRNRINQYLDYYDESPTSGEL